MRYGDFVTLGSQDNLSQLLLLLNKQCIETLKQVPLKMPFNIGWVVTEGTWPEEK